MAEIDSQARSERLSDETLDSGINREAASSRAETETGNRALFREVNERIEELADGFDAGGHNLLICECDNPECTRHIEVTPAEYERVRSHARRFVVALTHQNPETETIVEQNERFAIVETYAGTASAIARKTDPRSHPNTRRHSN